MNNDTEKITKQTAQTDEKSGAGSTDKKKVKQNKNPMSKKKKIIIGVAAACTLIIVAGAILIGSALNEAKEIIAGVHNDIPESYDLSIKDVDGYINILLMGVDSRNMENISGTRSDLIMIASINKDTNDVKLTSIYRDTFLKMGDTYTYDKITHACAYGGPELTIKSINQALDLNISTYVLVNFKAVADAVDAVGGIDVVVEDYEIYQLNKYTKQTARNIGETDYKLVETPGFQTLEGVQAVSYGRIRKGVGDDFKRTERMRTVVEKVLEKVKKMSFSDIRKIIDVVTPSVKTNLTFDDVLGLAFRLPSYNIISGKGWPYEVGMGNINGTSYVFPADLYSNVAELHNEVFGKENYEPSSMVYEISSGIISRRSAATVIQNLPEEDPEPEKLPDLETEDNQPSGEGAGSSQGSGGSGEGAGSSQGSGGSGEGAGSGQGSGGSGEGAGSGQGSEGSGEGTGGGQGSGESGEGTGGGQESGSGEGTGGGQESGDNAGNEGGSDGEEQPGSPADDTSGNGDQGGSEGTDTNP